MINKNNKRKNRQGEKIYRYSIRKYGFGVVSVAISALIYFGGGAGVAHAQEGVSPDTAIEGNKPVVAVEMADTERNKATEKEETASSESVADKVSEKETVPKRELTALDKEKQALYEVANDMYKYLPMAEKIQKDDVSEKVKQGKELFHKVADILQKKDVTVKELQEIKVKAEKVRNSLVIMVQRENSGRNDSRNGKSMLKAMAIGSNFRSESAVSEILTVAPLGPSDQLNHYKKYQDENEQLNPNTGQNEKGLNKKLADLNKQLYYIDWADTTAVTYPGGTPTTVTVDVGGNQTGYELKVGTVWKKEIAPGYIVTVKVKELKNILGEENGVDLKKDSEKYNVVRDAGGNPDERYNSKVYAWKQNFNNYSAAYKDGLDVHGNSAVSGGMRLSGGQQPSGNGLNIGVTFEVSAEYNGKSVKPNVFFVSAEESSGTEVEIYKTNGKGWELLTELTNSKVTKSFQALNTVNQSTAWMGVASRFLGSAGYDKEFQESPEGQEMLKKIIDAVKNNTITSDTISVVDRNSNSPSTTTGNTDGLGTQTFGPVNANQNANSTPIVFSRGATEVSAYLLSAGAQAFTIGVVAFDEGDAPASYGEAVHIITPGRDANVAEVKHPFIGSEKADVDEKDLNTTRPSWTRDDETANKDEGARQLMGDKVQKNDNYTLHKANDKTYELEIQADPNGNAESYVKAWVDFNNNGKFDEDEASELVKVTQKGTIKLVFKNVPQNVDTTVNRLGMRVRTAIAADDVENPTGVAYSGEVEDFKIQQVIPPRGEKATETGEQGEKQTKKVSFNAYGEMEYDLDKATKIDETKAPVIIKKDGSEVTAADLDSDGYYVVAGQGKYKVTGKGKDAEVEFIPDINFVGIADGITIRRTDTNGNTTGWGKNGNPIVGGRGENSDQLDLVNDQLNTMDGMFVPTVTPKKISGSTEKSTGIQGAQQDKTPTFTIDLDKDKDGKNDEIKPSEEYPAKLVDPKTNKPTDEKEIDAYDSKDAENKTPIGKYEIDSKTGKVTFKPNKDYVGTPKAATISLTAKVGQDKDGNAVTETATATYEPTVIGVKPEANDSSTTGIQGANQKSKVVFDASDEDANTLNFNKGTAKVDEADKSVELKPDSIKLVKAGTAVPDENGNIKVEGQGTYSIVKENGETFIQFAPEKSYKGNVTPVTVQIEDENGTVATAIYTPKIVGVTPAGGDRISEGLQGDNQEGTVSFTPGKATVNGEEITVPIKENSAVLLKADGSEARKDDGTPDKVDAVNAEGKKVGEYSIDPATNKVTFVPTDKTYAGDVIGVTVRATDENGTPAESTYKPRIIGVMPTGISSETKGKQGAKQTSDITLTGDDQNLQTLNFMPGSGTANNVTAMKSLNLNTLKLTDADKDGKVVVKDPNTGEIQGVYEIITKDDGSKAIEFTPTPKFTGTAVPVTVEILDENGTKATATYTPTVTPVNFSHKDATSTGTQGSKQKGTPEFSVDDKEVTFTGYTLVDPKDNSEKTEVTIPGEGTYSVDPKTGEVTFTPEAGFTTEDKDAQGVVVRGISSTSLTEDARYTPKVTPVAPTSTPGESNGLQGAVQKGNPTFTAPTVGEDVKLSEPTFTFADGSTDPKTVDGVGTYTIDPKSGVVTFIPVAEYKGTPDGIEVKATYKLTSSDGKTETEISKTDKYVPTVEPVEAKGMYEPTEDTQGSTQLGTPKFEAPKAGEGVKVSEPTFAFEDGSTEPKKVDGVGTYTIDPKSGVVTFVPVAGYVTTDETPAETVNIKAVYTLTSADGKTTTEISANAKYKAVVTPVTAMGKDDVSKGRQGEKQTKTLEFTISDDKNIAKDKDGKLNVTYSFADGSTTYTEDGEGTYTIDSNTGLITFNPLPNYTGTAKGIEVVASYVLESEDEEDMTTATIKATAKYIPTVTPVNTIFIDGKGKVISPQEKGKQNRKEIKGYKFIKTTVDENGNIIHHYEKITGKSKAPKTGDNGTGPFAGFGLLGLLGAMGLSSRKKKD